MSKKHLHGKLESGLKEGGETVPQKNTVELLVRVLGQVEWVFTCVNECNVDWRCPWCHGWKDDGHKADCPRQLALAQAKEVLLSNAN